MIIKDRRQYITQIKIGEPALNSEWGRARTAKGNQEYRQGPMFTSWGLGVAQTQMDMDMAQSTDTDKDKILSLSIF